MSVVFSALGLIVLAWRLGPRVPGSKTEKRVPGTLFSVLEPGTGFPRVSVIVPARNEEANLPKLLTSLIALPFAEIIVVDDLSEDRTFEVASLFAAMDLRVRVLQTPAKPQGWTGKNWACQHGAAAATGDYLLFTDADTVHLAGSLDRALAMKADLVSAIPFHECASFLERLMGPFHLLVFISSSAFARPRPGSLFAIGQYLLFTRDAYFKQGGHEAIRASFADDLDLAESCLRGGGTYALETSGSVFKVRMYSSFADFLAGWKRIFRLGFGHASVLRVLEIFFVIACLTESFRFMRASAAEILMALGGLVILAFAQRRYGNFSWIGALLAPLGLGTFVYVSVTALWDRILRRDLRWRGRRYKLST